MQSRQELLRKRHQIDLLRTNDQRSLAQENLVENSILSSWQRSSKSKIPTSRLAAPMSENYSSDPQSSLNTALNFCGSELQHVAEHSGMVLAIGNVGSTIIWSAASKSMRKSAEMVNFVEGACWEEEIVGTNAIALSVKTQQSSCVFSNEHYMSSIQEWVCYAAPIFNPWNKSILGVVDLSTTWDKHNNLGILAAERCASIIQNALLKKHTPYLYIKAFSYPQILLNGNILSLTPRQIEIITILALHPAGISLENLHYALYGDKNIKIGTLKTEMSKLKKIFGGGLCSRPYRFTFDVEGDFLEIEKTLDSGYCIEALQLYKGIFLEYTESIFLCLWRNILEARLCDVLYRSSENEILLNDLKKLPKIVSQLTSLISLLPKSHPIHHLISHR